MNWLLLRGLSRETRHWGEMQARLQNEYPDSKILSLDLPGAGRKHKESSPTEMPDYIFNLKKDFLKAKRGIEGPWSVLAISFGGMIAMEWAHIYPLDFSSLVLINSSASNVASPFERLQIQNLMLAFKILISRKSRTRELAILEQTLNLKSPKEFIESWTNFQEEYPLLKINIIKQLYAAAIFIAPEVILPPLLFLISQNDKIVNNICSQRLAERYHASSAMHPTAGHDLPLDDPQWVITKIKEFNTELSRPR